MLIRFGPPNNFHLPTPLVTITVAARISQMSCFPMPIHTHNYAGVTPILGVLVVDRRSLSAKGVSMLELSCTRYSTPWAGGMSRADQTEKTTLQSTSATFGKVGFPIIWKAF